MANKGWSKRFDEPIVLDDGTTLTTLQQQSPISPKSFQRPNETPRQC
jgi:hypothetical protein